MVVPFPDTPWDCHIYLHWGGARGVNVGIYGSPMECLGLNARITSMILPGMVAMPSCPHEAMPEGARLCRM